MNGRNIVDSSGWLEYLIGTERSGLYSDAILDAQNLIVPVISIYEVLKRTLRSGDENDAMIAVNAMIQGQIIDPTFRWLSMRRVINCHWRTASSTPRHKDSVQHSGRRMSTSKTCRVSGTLRNSDFQGSGKAVEARENCFATLKR